MKRWEVLREGVVKDSEILDVLLENRDLRGKKSKEEFLDPVDPMNIPIEKLGVKTAEVKKAISRIREAKKNGESVIVYGDYDADGITGTATMWEALHSVGVHVLPHIPERFSEGYGLNLETVKRLKEKDPKLGLIVTVDHGIVAGKKVSDVKKMGIDMIISDHHMSDGKMPNPYALIYTTDVGGSALSWFLAREITKSLKVNFDPNDCLELAAIGTIADQLPLTGANRSIVKFGVKRLNKTKRLGLRALIEDSGIKKEEIGTYEVGFVIAPRINSMGRLRHGLESLRLLCTKDPDRAKQIAKEIGNVNTERQKIVETVVLHARNSYKPRKDASVIILVDESYHEGVIGLAAARLVEEFYRPAIVMSKKSGIAKASARSISGFNIIEAIRTFESLYIEGGGHTMAAGFSIEEKNINEFSKKLNSYAAKILTPEILSKKLKIDLETPFSNVTKKLYTALKSFEPTGVGNPTPTFMTKKVEVVSAKKVGKDLKHLKLKLKRDEHIFDSIFFGGGEMYPDLKTGSSIDVAYVLQENLWNGRSSLELLVRDIHF